MTLFCYNDTMKLKTGVHLQVIKETKFKTLRLMLRFREPVTKENTVKRALISDLWKIANVAYPTGQALSAHLAEMYGATLSTGSGSKGAQHFLSLSMSIVNPALVGEDLLNEALESLQQVIFQPLWNVENFEVEKENFLHYLKAMKEDHQAYAAQRLSEIYFTDRNQAPLLSEVITMTEKLTMAELQEYYEKMLAEDQIDILVLGDVNAAEVEAVIEDWPFTARKNEENLTEVFYQQELQPLSELTETVEGSQSVLAMAWQLPVCYGDSDYLALQVMNGLFGGLPHSKLFSIVRERESLAYGISSSFDSFTGLFRVFAGIDADNFEKTRDLINELLSAVSRGDFTADDIQQTKDMLRNGYFISQDNSSALMEEAFMADFLPERYLDEAAWLAALDAVTAEDIQTVAKKLTAQVVYLLKGE